MASVPSLPVWIAAYVPAPTTSLRAATSVSSGPPSSLFSISMRPKTSASIAASAATIFASWRSNSSWSFAPRWSPGTFGWSRVVK